jgi:hypothetical protein
MEAPRPRATIAVCASVLRPARAIEGTWMCSATIQRGSLCHTRAPSLDGSRGCGGGEHAHHTVSVGRHARVGTVPDASCGEEYEALAGAARSPFPCSTT